MYCPNCRSEYEEGFTDCADCEVALVAELGPEPFVDYANLVTVFTPLNEVELTLAQSLLHGAKIRFLAKGEWIQDLFAVGRMMTGFNPVVGPVEIQVLPEDEKKARKILDEVVKKRDEPVPPDEDAESGEGGPSGNAEKCMYCPDCRAEYREGFDTCSDCGVALVAELSPLPEPDYEDLVTVFTVMNDPELMLAASLLQRAKIRYFVLGEGIQDLFGLGRVGVGFNPMVGPVRIQVLSADEKKALKVLKEVEEKRNAPVPADEDGDEEEELVEVPERFAYCPKCRAEYREGCTVCADCSIELVDELPPEDEIDYTDLVTVLMVANEAELMLAESLLEGAKIRYFAKGENVQDLFGLGRVGGGFNPLIGPVEIQVLPDDSIRAREILEEVERLRNLEVLPDDDE